MYHFEGSEKKSELIVSAYAPSLRSLPGSVWEEVVTKAGATILSRISNDHVDAYLLSESSLFVFDRKAIMITCGRTHLVEAVGHLFNFISLEQVETFYYERKNEVFPRYQPSDFIEDCHVLSQWMKGRGFRFGELDDHYIYLWHFDRADKESLSEETTLEILMHGLQGEAREAFDHSDRSRKIKSLGISERLFSGFEVDDYIFEPRGYSVNAISGSCYGTLHVSPEEFHSYASFETNDPLKINTLPEFVKEVVDLFQPRAFDVVLFSKEVRTFHLGGSFQRKAQVFEKLSSGLWTQFHSFLAPELGIQRAIPISSSLEMGEMIR